MNTKNVMQAYFFYLFWESVDQPRIQATAVNVLRKSVLSPAALRLMFDLSVRKESFELAKTELE